MLRIVCMLLVVMIPEQTWATLQGVTVSKASIVVHPEQVICPIRSTLFGVNINTYDKPNLAKPEFIERVKKMGIGSCRFPNGCEADIYNWKSPEANQATIDEFLDFCDAIGAEPYYTINMQGGTEGLTGSAPKDAPLDEIIKYRHLAPNPCGYTNYHFGTLAEAVELVRKYTVDRAANGKKPILHYEMGNENWGQAFTDWTPEVYARTIEVYAKAMRAVASKSKLKLHITAVGFPVMGNNMKMVDSPDRTTNINWTAALNRLYKKGVIDAVQEHFYPHASANGGALVWAVHNLHNIILARKGKPNQRLGGYKDLALMYSMPLEYTEWNVKCWGPKWAEDVQLVNSGFEEGLTGWSVYPESTSATNNRPRAIKRAARRGKSGLEISVSTNSGPIELTQVFKRPERAKTIVAGVWVRTNKPDAVKIRFRRVDDLERKGEILGGWSSKLVNMWERVMASAKMPEDVEQVELALSVESPALAFIDEVKLYYTTEDRGQCAISATTFEQQLFCVDALREMAANNCLRSHLHHLVGDYPCGAMSASGETKDLAKVFELFSGTVSSRHSKKDYSVVVRTDCKCETFSYYSAGNSWATDFNALAPDRTDIPMLGCLAYISSDASKPQPSKQLHILLINRTSDRNIEVSIDLGAEPVSRLARVKTLSGLDIDLPGATLTENSIQVARRFKHTIPPYTARIISVRLK